MEDTRRPCSSCGRKDFTREIKLEQCQLCKSHICSACTILHKEYDHMHKEPNNLQALVETSKLNLV